MQRRELEYSEYFTEAPMNPTLTYYNQKASDFTADTRDVIFTEIQDMFLGYIPSQGKILDFGCGSGRDTKYFLEKGYEVDATDGSEELCRIATDFTGISVQHMLFEELDAVEAFDGIWACASILHVEKKQLPDIFRKMATALKTNGTLYASFKYGDFEGIKNGRFFTYLTEETFGELIKAAPVLSVEKLWISSDVRAGREEERWLNLILKKRQTDC